MSVPHTRGARLRDRVRDPAPPVSEEPRAAWQAVARARVEGSAQRARPQVETELERGFVLLVCRDEQQQVDVLGRLSAEGLDCRALLA